MNIYNMHGVFISIKKVSYVTAQKLLLCNYFQLQNKLFVTPKLIKYNIQLLHQEKLKTKKRFC